MTKGEVEKEKKKKTLFVSQLLPLNKPNMVSSWFKRQAARGTNKRQLLGARCMNGGTGSEYVSAAAATAATAAIVCGTVGTYVGYSVQRIYLVK